MWPRISVQSTHQQTAKTTVYNKSKSIYYATPAHLAVRKTAPCLPHLFFKSFDTVLFLVRYICTHFTFV